MVRAQTTSPIQLLTTTELSELLRIPADTLKAWRFRETPFIPYVKIRGEVRYKMTDVLAYLESRKRGVAQ